MQKSLTFRATDIEKTHTVTVCKNIPALVGRLQLCEIVITFTCMCFRVECKRSRSFSEGLEETIP